MSTGVLLFAYNNTAVDYVKQAIYNAKLIKQHLNLPVVIVTDSVNYLEKTYPFYKKYVDNVIFRDTEEKKFQYREFYGGEHYSAKAEWKNVNRASAYDITPFETTIVLDTDYLINNDNLLKLINQPDDLFIYKNSHDISYSRKIKALSTVSDETIDFYWATVLVFKKTPRTKKLFDLVNYIKRNYHYFRTLYRIPLRLYRNDYAFSIAIHMLNGYQKTEWPKQPPGKMLYSSPEDDLISIKDGKYIFALGNRVRPDKVNIATIKNLNIHVMNKLHLNDLIDKEFENE